MKRLMAYLWLIAVMGMAGSAVGQPGRDRPLSPQEFDAANSNPDVAEYEALKAKFVELVNAGKRSEAAQVAQQVVVLDERINGPSQRVLDLWGFVASQHQSARRMPAAIAAWKRVVELSETLFKNQPWEIATAKGKLAHAENLAKLDQAGWKQFAEANANFDRMVAHWKAGELGPAIETGSKAFQGHREILGDDDYLARVDLFLLARVAFDGHDFKSAEEVLRMHLQAEQNVHGAEHPNVATALCWLGKCQTSGGDAQAALESHLKALEISRKVRPPDADELREDVAYAAAAYEQLGMHEQALPLMEESLKLDAKRPGSVDLAMSHLNIGAVQQALNRYKEATTSYESALAILDGLPVDTPRRDFALSTALSNFGSMQLEIADFSAARKLLQRALAVYEQSEDDEAADVAPAVHNQLGHLESAIGNYAGAVREQSKACNLARERWGEDHPNSATILHDLGMACWENGDWASARLWMESAFQSRLRTLGPDNELVARSLAELAFYVGEMGDLKQAVEYAEASIPAALRAGGPDSLVAAYSYQNTALLMEELQQDLPKALELMEKSLAIRLKQQGKNNQDTAQAYGNYGSLLKVNGKLAEAEAATQEALAIYRKLFGEKSAETIVSLFNLGAIAAEQNKLEEASRYYADAAAVARASLAAGGPTLAVCLSEQAYFEARRGREAESRRLFDEAFAMRERIFAEQLPLMSEAQMQDFASSAYGDLSAYLSLPADAAAATRDAGWVLRLKSPAFQTLCRLRSMQGKAGRDDDVEAITVALRENRERLARLTIRPPQGYSKEEIAAEIAALTRNVTALEVNLNVRLASAGGDSQPSQVAAETIAAKLPAGSALVEIVRYTDAQYGKPDAKPGATPQNKPVKYAAFVVFADKAKPTMRVDLGDAAAIDAAVAKISDHFNEARDWYKSKDQLTDEATLEASYRQTAKALSEQLFKPLAGALGDVRLIYLAPDSQLHGLPFEALVDDAGKYLVESGYRFAYLTAGRDLLAADNPPGKGTVVFAGPNYDLASQAPAAEAVGGIAGVVNETLDLTALDGEGPPTSVRSQDTRGLNWDLLPGAVAEGAAVAAQFADGAFAPVSTYNGDDAKEGAFKKLHGPRALVMVTHGYFLEPQPRNELNDWMDESSAPSMAGAASGLSRLRSAENPLLRSGLILAGANRADQLADSAAGPAVEDGWLTAYEIAGLDLRGVDLAVLSACNSGRGAASSGEAIAGLRTAFLTAGVRTLVASLYEVPDAEAAAMMKDFYESVRGGAPTLEALSKAELKVIADRRAAGQAAHPFFWASFVVAGRP